MSRVVKQAAIVAALVLCVPIAALAFVSSLLISVVETLVGPVDD